MRNLYILVILCIVGTYGIPTNQRYHPDALACAKESHFNLDTFWNTDISIKEFRQPEEYHCFESCMILKRMKQRGFEKTIHEALMDVISFVDMEYDHFKDKTYTRVELEGIANGCNAEGLSECDYLKCIHLLDPPFLNFFMTAAL